MSSRALSLSLLIVLSCSWLGACELIADFDRGKLTPVEQRRDSGVSDVEDAGEDTATPDKGAD